MKETFLLSLSILILVACIEEVVAPLSILTSKSLISKLGKLTFSIFSMIILFLYSSKLSRFFFLETVIVVGSFDVNSFSC